MDKELKSLVVEIITLTLFLIVMVPVCVRASNDYQEKREVLLSGANTFVDISNKGDIKKITIYSNYDKVVNVNLVMKISKFSNDYYVVLDEEKYLLKELEHFEDEENIYYNLGIYEVDKFREFDFQLQIKDKSYYDETITYSFLTEGFVNEDFRLQ